MLLMGTLASSAFSEAFSAVPDGMREAELAARQKDMDADQAALKKRLTRVPGYIEEFRAELQKIRDAKGINSTGILFGPPLAMEAMAEDRKIDVGGGNAMDALTTFSRELKERGVDLMVVPYPTHAEVYGHRLFKNRKPDDELWPARVEGLIKLLENDVEVIECGDAFKAYKGKGRVLGAYDHHFEAAGIDILAKELGRRINNRYDFAKEAAAGRKLFTTQEIQVNTPSFFLNYNGISAAEAKALKMPPTISVEQVTYKGTVDLSTRIDPVFMMGDSSVPFGAGRYDPGVGHGVGSAYPEGYGIPSHLSMELGRLVPYSSDHWGAHKQCAWYVRQHAKTIPQPRVLILVMVGYSLYFNQEFLGRWSIAHLPPLPVAVEAVTAPDQAPVKTEATDAAPDKKTAAPAPAPAKPFRATVELTKVSVPPDPKKTPYKEAFTVSEAKVTKLWSQADGVAVGDTILLVEWVMRDRRVLFTVSQQRVGNTRMLDLTRWEKKLNAKENETRMIMDDTENYDARMYWVGAGLP